MLFYTSATIAQLPQARALAHNLRQYHPTASIYLLFCDRLPGGFRLEDSRFDGIIYSNEIPLSGPIGSEYWHFMHTTKALQAAAIPGGALAALTLSKEEKLIYLAPSTSITCSLDILDRLLDDHDIIVTPHPMQSIADFDPRLSAYDPDFFAVNFPTIQGTLFLHRWKYAAETLWQTKSEMDAYAYNRLMDATPALFDSCCILQDTNLDSLSEAERMEYGSEYLERFPNYYSRFENGRPITAAERSRARRDKCLWEQFGESDPFAVTEAPCLYHALGLPTRDEPPTEHEESEFPDAKESLGQKMTELVGKLLPTARLHKKSSEADTASDLQS